jgi:hypothetical protein
MMSRRFYMPEAETLPSVQSGITSKRNDESHYKQDHTLSPRSHAVLILLIVQNVLDEDDPTTWTFVVGGQWKGKIEDYPDNESR